MASKKANDPRSPFEVFDDHLCESQQGTVEADLQRNYADNVAMLTSRGVYRGHASVQKLAQLLVEELGDHMSFEYRTRLVEGDVAFLEWSARGSRGCVEDGADSYLIRDGHVVVQTIHYTVKKPAETETAGDCGRSRG